MALTKPAAGQWRYEDLFSLPDDGKRYEIIEGELFEMPAPSSAHQTIIMNVILLIAPVIQAMGGRILVSPLDVFFEGADPVQPDIVVMLSGWTGTLYQRGPQGAPDLLIEILSPSNRGHDVLTKRALYALAGVREYWIVDPENRTIEILTLDQDAFHTASVVSGQDSVISPLLGAMTFPLAAVFARLDDIQD
ncbi:MAG: Uma2 family endonuclease [Chloroflexia bacterium]|nr:Uma2 family endonuclease [Chloroflexia bacterium]